MYVFYDVKFKITSKSSYEMEKTRFLVQRTTKILSPRTAFELTSLELELVS